MKDTKVLDKLQYVPDNTNSELDKIKQSIQQQGSDLTGVTSELGVQINQLKAKTDTTNTNVTNLTNKVNAGQNHKLCEDNGTAKLLAGGFDLDTLKATGIYNGTSLVHAPNNDTGWWYIEVMQHSNLNGFCYQKATTLADSSNIKVFHRECISNTWGTWRSL